VPSACFTHADHECEGIYLFRNRVSGIVNRADEAGHVKRWCDNSNVNAFGIEVESYGDNRAGALSDVVVEGNTVEHTRTGQSETVAINGDVRDFLVARNLIYDTDNIGIDIEGWYSGTDQARHGLIYDNAVANVDTWSNRAYGIWSPRLHSCLPLSPNAAGIYDDGAADIWIARNLVTNTDQGISLDTETARNYTDDILVTHNRVIDDPGTRIGDSSIGGANPPGIPGRSRFAGHAYDAFYVDAFGPRSRIFDVSATDNTFINESRYFGARYPQSALVVDFGGSWHDVVLESNVISRGPTKSNTLVGLDSLPTTPMGSFFGCTEYQGTVGGPMFYDPAKEFGSFEGWRTGNPFGWDAKSAFGRRPSCMHGKVRERDGAGGRTRTDDLTITNRLRYQLRHTGK